LPGPRAGSRLSPSELVSAGFPCPSSRWPGMVSQNRGLPTCARAKFGVSVAAGDRSFAAAAPEAPRRRGLRRRHRTGGTGLGVPAVFFADGTRFPGRFPGTRPTVPSPTGSSNLPTPKTSPPWVFLPQWKKFLLAFRGMLPDTNGRRTAGRGQEAPADPRRVGVRWRVCADDGVYAAVSEDAAAKESPNSTARRPPGPPCVR